MKSKSIYLLISFIAAVAAYKCVFAINVKDKVSAQFLEAFPSEWVVNFDSAHYNAITNNITVKGVEFPSTGSTIGVMSFTDISGIDVLPDTVSFSFGNVKGLPALLIKQFPDIDWDKVIKATIKDRIKEKDLIGELSVLIDRDKNNVILSVFFGIDYIQNFRLDVTLNDIHPVLNGNFGRFVRSKRLTVDNGGFVAGFIDVVKGLPDSRGMHVEVGGFDFTHTVVGVNSAYESLALIEEGSDIDLFFEEMHQYRRFGTLEAGSSTVLVITPFSFYDYINSAEDDKALLIRSSMHHNK